MDLAKRLIARCANVTGATSVELDLDAFVKRILLFDHYILSSICLRELEGLVQSFGPDGVIAILESGAISLDCFPPNTGSLGPSLFTEERPPGELRPPFHYSLARIEIAEPLLVINQSIDELSPRLGLRRRQLVRLRRAVNSALVPKEDSTREISLEATAHELTANINLLVRACSLALSRHIGRTIPPDEITLHPTQLSQYDFRIESNLQSDHGLTQLDAHRVVEKAVLAIAGRNDRIEMMLRHKAISGFTDDDLPVFEDKLAFLAKSLNTQTSEARLQRVIEIRDLPAIPFGTSVPLDAKRLLGLRKAPEYAQFRDWLATTDEMTDEEIAREGRAIGAQIGLFIRSGIGRTIRFLVTTSLGMIPGPSQIASLALGILDQFAIERIFTQSGPISFVDSLYPSIFSDR